MSHNAFPERGTNLVTKSGWKRRFIALKVGVSPDWLSTCLKGKGNLGNSALLNFASLFNTSVDYLTGKSDDPAPKKDVA